MIQQIEQYLENLEAQFFPALALWLEHGPKHPNVRRILTSDRPVNARKKGLLETELRRMLQQERIKTSGAAQRAPAQETKRPEPEQVETRRAGDVKSREEAWAARMHHLYRERALLSNKLLVKPDAPEEEQKHNAPLLNDIQEIMNQMKEVEDEREQFMNGQQQAGFGANFSPILIERGAGKGYEAYKKDDLLQMTQTEKKALRKRLMDDELKLIKRLRQPSKRANTQQKREEKLTSTRIFLRILSEH